MNNKQGFIPLALLVAILIVVAGGGVYYFVKQKHITFPPIENKTAKQIHESTTENLQATTTTNETTNWKIYQNKDFNFSLKYPTNWKVTDRFDNELHPELTFERLNFENAGKDYKGYALISIFPSFLYGSQDISKKLAGVNKAHRPITIGQWQGRRAIFDWGPQSGSDEIIIVSRPWQSDWSLSAEWNSDTFIDNPAQRTVTAEKEFFPILLSVQPIETSFSLPSKFDLLRKFRALPDCGVGDTSLQAKRAEITNEFWPKDKPVEEVIGSDLFEALMMKVDLKVGCRYKPTETTSTSTTK